MFMQKLLRFHYKSEEYNSRPMDKVYKNCTKKTPEKVNHLESNLKKSSPM